MEYAILGRQTLPKGGELGDLGLELQEELARW